MKIYKKFFVIFLLLFFNTNLLIANKNSITNIHDILKEKNRDSFDDNKIDDIEYIKKRLSLMFENDQLIRKNLTPNYIEKLSELMREIDKKNASELSKIIDKHYWISCKKFGENACKHALTIALHSGSNPELQHKVLFRLANYYPIGEVPPQHYALLYDRILALNYAKYNLKQRYGTQFIISNSGKKILLPFEGSISDLNKRRLEMRLPLLDEKEAKVDEG